MRKIMAIKYQIRRKSKAGEDYDLYCYILDDGEEVESVTKYEVNTPVTVWYDDKWDKLKLKPKKINNN
jgi:hypothetical protein